MNDNIKRTPKEWMKITGITIIDPDGWRHDNKSMDDPILFEEWKERQQMSTCMGHFYKFKDKNNE